MQFLRFIRGLVTVSASFLLLASPPAFAQNKHPLRVYFVGNSVTDTLHYEEFAQFFTARGETLIWGRHVIPGTPLFLLWQTSQNGKQSGFTQEPFGASVKAMTEYDWDAVTLQPFDRHENDKNDTGYDEGDIPISLNYINAQRKRNPNVRFYIYARWARMSVKGKPVAFDRMAYLDKTQAKNALPTGLDDWQNLWNRPYTGGWDNTNEAKAYFEKLTLALRAKTPDLKEPVRMIPVGYVMAELDKRMRAGKISGYHSIWQFYNDGIHLDGNGAYVVACTFYATLTGKSPVGLPYAGYKVANLPLARTIQEAAWLVVRRERLSGVQ